MEYSLKERTSGSKRVTPRVSKMKQSLIDVCDLEVQQIHHQKKWKVANFDEVERKPEKAKCKSEMKKEKIVEN